MKQTTRQTPAGLKPVPAASLRSRFYAYRSAVLAVASIGALRAAATLDDRDAARRLRSLVSERSAAMQDSTQDPDAFTLSSPLAAIEETAPRGFAGSDLLTPAERAAIAAARPGARSVIFRAAPVAAPEVSDLPAGFVPAAVPEYVPLLTRDAAIEAEAARAAEFELAWMTEAAEGYETRDAEPIDYAPDGSEGGAPEVAVMRAAPVTPAKAPAASRLSVTPRAAATVAAPGSSDADLLAAVFAKAAKRATATARGFATRAQGIRLNPSNYV